jgi:hypothetical protein
VRRQSADNECSGWRKVPSKKALRWCTPAHLHHTQT